MPAFEYAALDARGRQVKGLIDGDTPRHARSLMRERGLTPLQLEEVAEGRERGDRPLFGPRGGKLSATDLALLTRQLATLTRSGLPLAEALAAIGQQAENARVERVVMGVRARVVEGHSLADGLADFPRAFPEIYQATVSAGEQSGRLDDVLERLADYTERRQQLRSKISLALLYPAILVSLAVLIVGGMMTFVVPKLIGVLQSTGQELPLITRALIGTSEFFVDYWIHLCIALVVAGFAFTRALRVPAFRGRWHILLLHLPIVGRITRGADAARFSRTLSILAASGVPVLDALRIAGEVVVTLPMREAVQQAAVRVREGAPIARSLGDSGQFPPMLIHLIRSGEQSGELEGMLERAADNQERELETLISTLVGVLEPVLLLVMGGIVMTIVMAMLLPIYNNYQAIG